tara:strand:+ start:378 stop:578 length:201 start_codon:yes stop_codon:yes gene_type:complete
MANWKITVIKEKGNGSKKVTEGSEFIVESSNKPGSPVIKESVEKSLGGESSPYPNHGDSYFVIEKL